MRKLLIALVLAVVCVLALGGLATYSFTPSVPVSVTSEEPYVSFESLSQFVFGNYILHPKI
jgi:hypothetical protein